MDVQKELQEIRAMNARVQRLEQRNAPPAVLRQAMQVAAKPGETTLGYQARILIYSYASDFLAAAESRGILLTFQPEEAETIPSAIGSAYECNRAQRGLPDGDNLVLISKQLGCYLALTLCHGMGGTIQVQSVPVHPVKGFSALLVSGMQFQVALPRHREVRPIEVANKVMRSVAIGETGLTMNQRPILQLLANG